MTSAGPRFALVFLQFYLSQARTSSIVAATATFISGLVRTFACGGWVYITSNDDHDVHDVLMIGYIVADLPWMVGGCMLAGSPAGKAKRCVEALLRT